MECHRPSSRKLSSKNAFLEIFILIHEFSPRIFPEVMEISFKWIILFGNDGGRWHAIGLRFENYLPKLPFLTLFFYP